MKFLKSIRPSNLIILFALPFIFYLFIVSNDYSRSLRAIVGVEPGSSNHLPGFLLCTFATMSGLSVPLLLERRRRVAQICAVFNLALVTVLAFGSWHIPFVTSVVANGVDAFTSDLVVRGQTPRRLTEAAMLLVEDRSSKLFYGYLAISLTGMAILFSNLFANLRKVAWWSLITINGLAATYILLFAYFGFASGLSTSIRAALLAYCLANLIGMLWVGLMQLHAKARTPFVFTALTVACLAISLWAATRSHVDYALFGTLSGKSAVIPGTPHALVEAVRFASFPGAPVVSDELPTRTFADAQSALKSLRSNEGVSAALLPANLVPPDMPVIWRVSTLPDAQRTTATGFFVIAVILALLTFGGLIHTRHPLSIGSEFIVDTLRGIPMLVIVLYIGLPLSGSLKDMTNGYIDPPNMLRGIVAMALAYSAYLAEIFRSGIKAVQIGQVEAAHSFGFSRWLTAKRIILPQAFQIVIPPLGNEFIAILKDTSLLSILSIRDITQRMREFQSASFLPFAPYNSTAILYLLMTLLAASLVASIERKYDVKHR